MAGRAVDVELQRVEVVRGPHHRDLPRRHAMQNESIEFLVLPIGILDRVAAVPHVPHIGVVAAAPGEVVVTEAAGQDVVGGKSHDGVVAVRGSAPQKDRANIRGRERLIGELELLDGGVLGKEVYARELTDDRQLARRRPIDVDDQVRVIVAAAPQAEPGRS